MKKKAVVLLSGGLDSATVLGIAKSNGYECFALSFSYGQKHDKELECSVKIADYFSVTKHKIVPLRLGSIISSALTDENQEIPKDRKPPEMTDIPASYVPARNTIMLSIALAYAEVTESQAIFIGVNAVDYSGYPDCRPEYIEAYQELANLATKRAVEGNSVEIKTPLLHLKKSEIISIGIKLGIPYNLTWSCYQGGKKACGKCDSCILRLKGFSEANVKDPIEYA